MILLRHPWVLLLLALALPLVWWSATSARRRAAIRFSGVARFLYAPRTWADRARRLPVVLRCLAVAFLVLALARPQKADEQTRVQKEGVAIQLVVDRSGSMSQADFLQEDGSAQNRLDAVKSVVKSFILGDDRTLRGRPDDLIGLIVFARYADTECPMTRDHSQLLRAMEAVEVPRTRDEDGTAIGDALLLAVERIRSIERKMRPQDEIKIKSRVIVLLTDGEQNAGKYKPEKAAEAAAALGLKVYTIGAAPEFQEQSVGGIFTRPQRIRVPVTVDEKMLQHVAEMTGGRYFRARDTASLRDIYAEIDRLERSVVDEERYYLYEELAYHWARFASIRTPPPLLVALGLLTLELLLSCTRFRRIP
jgi:Ca-activated chloride channel family protein